MPINEIEKNKLLNLIYKLRNLIKQLDIQIEEKKKNCHVFHCWEKTLNGQHEECAILGICCECKF